VKTFTIGFLEDAYNEAAYAKRVASHLRTDHTELYLTPEQTLAVVPRLPELYDEPFADSSQIPTFLVAQLARERVTVSLSGDAGDELFGGYNRYQWATALRRSVGWLPSQGRRAIAAVLASVAPAHWDLALETATPLLPAKLRYKSAGDKAHKLAYLLQARDDDDLYRRLVSFWPAEVVLGAAAPAGWWEREMPATLSALPERMMALDTLGYLPDDILVKVDRAAMGVSLETRIPLLDHRVVEFAWRLPLAMKIRNGRTKWLLRSVLQRYVPAELIERQKMGFSVPLDRWLRGPLRSWAEALLDEARLRREGLLDAGAIRQKWREHLSGARSWQNHLWTVLMFQAWRERWQRA
jgi:asparagine synthase (glutamine-hydrolysing)